MGTLSRTKYTGRAGVGRDARQSYRRQKHQGKKHARWADREREGEKERKGEPDKNY